MTSREDDYVIHLKLNGEVADIDPVDLALYFTNFIIQFEEMDKEERQRQIELCKVLNAFCHTIKRNEN